MSEPNLSALGRVYLVGAGPGDPKLITLRGVECLRRADIILYDYLVNTEILKHASATAERICLGHHGETRIRTQEEINRKLVESAQSGKTVVRLKGGDPMVFGRAAEETEPLVRAGIPYEIVPCVTAALAAASYGGVPITHRDHASAVALITAQQQARSPRMDYASLAQFPGTLVFYMGVTTAAQWTGDLIRGGKPPETPAAIIRRCSLPDQLLIRCRLDEVPERLTHPVVLRPPAVVVVGPVAAAEAQITWFQQRPLFGQRIVVTRPEAQAGDLANALAELGASVTVQPAIQILAPEDWGPVDAALEQLDHFDWLVFSSANGVRYLFERLLAKHGDLRSLGRLRLAAIGPGTQAALWEYHLRADVLPEEYRAEALAEALAADAKGRTFLLARASRGRELLAQQLQAAGGGVTQVVVYESQDVTRAAPEVAQQLEAGVVDWITVTSSAIAHSLIALFGDSLHECRLVSISPVTSSTLRESGFTPAAEARTYTMEGVVEAILEHS